MSLSQRIFPWQPRKVCAKFLNSLSLKRIKKDNSVSFLFHASGQEDINFIDIVLTMGHWPYLIKQYLHYHLQEVKLNQVNGRMMISYYHSRYTLSKYFNFVEKFFSLKLFLLLTLRKMYILLPEHPSSSHILVLYKRKNVTCLIIFFGLILTDWARLGPGLYKAGLLNRS